MTVSVVITGSGDRVLHMLIASPYHVYAFDVNPVQNHLLELKIAAMKELNYHKFCCFIGLHAMNEQQREQIYYSIHISIQKESYTLVTLCLSHLEISIMFPFQSYGKQ